MHGSASEQAIQVNKSIYKHIGYDKWAYIYKNIARSSKEYILTDWDQAGSQVQNEKSITQE